MPILKNKCPKCGKVAEGMKEYNIGSKCYTTLSCGHIIEREILVESSNSPENIVSLDHKKLLPYQCEGVRFVEKSGGRALICDEMGLGKTVQALGSLALHSDKLLPALIVVKSSIKSQWQREFMRWLGEDYFAQIIDGSKDHWLKFAKSWIVSYDLLPRMKNLNEIIDNMGIQTLILDECQQIKNTSAGRSVEVRKLSKKIKNVIALSGTPIKNNAGEYFTILNVLRPELFPSETSFKLYECAAYWNGYSYKSGGLAYPEEFKEKTKNFIIRRERAEVMPELPKISRNFQFCDLASQVEDAYKATFLEFRDEYNGVSDHNHLSFSDTGNILQFLTRMRHLTGLSKVDPCVEFTLDFLEQTDRLLTIFVHHKDVAELIKYKLDRADVKPLSLTSDLNSEERQNIIDQFLRGDSRVLIASTLASGEGLNLQRCSDCIMLERQWNPANEEQAEGRFIRIGQMAESVTATYFVAVGTVDEFFAEIVEQKREIVTKTLGGEASAWDQSSLMKELADVLATKGGQRWSL